MVKQQRLYIDTPAPQRQIHTRYAGDTGPFIILLHQIPISCRQMERIVPVLGDFARAYALDLPGYGVSPAPAGPLPFSDYAGRLIDAIDALGAQRFVLLGVEIGVALAAEIYRQVGPQRVSHFIAIAPPPIDPAARKAFMEEIGVPQEENGQHGLPIWQRFRRRWGSNADNAMLRMAFTENLNVYHRYDWALKGFAGYDLAGALKAVAVPRLVISASEDQLRPHADAVARLMDAPHEVIPGGAAIVSTEPDKLGAVIARFVEIPR